MVGPPEGGIRISEDISKFIGNVKMDESIVVQGKDLIALWPGINCRIFPPRWAFMRNMTPQARHTR